MIDIAHCDGEYLINGINYASGVPVYRLEGNGHEIKAVNLLNEQETDYLFERMKAAVRDGSRVAKVAIHLDVAHSPDAYKFGLMVGLGAPREGEQKKLWQLLLLD